MKNKTLEQIKQWLDEGHWVEYTIEEEEVDTITRRFVGYSNVHNPRNSLVFYDEAVRISSDSFVERLLRDPSITVRFYPIPRKPKLLEVGDKVIIIEKTEIVIESGNRMWVRIVQEGTIGSVIEVCKEDWGISYFISFDGFERPFPHWAVAKIIVEENDQRTKV